MSAFKVLLEKKSDRTEVIDFLDRIYLPMSPFAPTIQKLTFSYEPSLKDDNLILARAANGDLIGVTRIVDRTIIINGVKLAAGGISSVGVRDDWRGRGVSAAMMRKAISLMKERQYALSILHARRVLDGYYVQFGYHGVGRYIDLEILNFPFKDKTAFKAVAYQKTDRLLIQKTYDKTYSMLSGSIVRTPAIWELLVRKIVAKVLKAEIVIFRDGAHKIGYGIVVDKKLVELIATEKYFPSIVSWIQKKSLQSVAIHPGHPFFIYCRENLNTIFKERLALDGGYMARVIDERSMAAKLGSRFTQKPLTQSSLGPFFHTSILDEV